MKNSNLDDRGGPPRWSSWVTIGVIWALIFVAVLVIGPWMYRVYTGPETSELESGNDNSSFNRDRLEKEWAELREEEIQNAKERRREIADLKDFIKRVERLSQEENRQRINTLHQRVEKILDKPGRSGYAQAEKDRTYIDAWLGRGRITGPLIDDKNYIDKIDGFLRARIVDQESLLEVIPVPEFFIDRRKIVQTADSLLRERWWSKRRHRPLARALLALEKRLKSGRIPRASMGLEQALKMEVTKVERDRKRLEEEAKEKDRVEALRSLELEFASLEELKTELSSKIIQDFLIAEAAWSEYENAQIQGKKSSGDKKKDVPPMEWFFNRKIGLRGLSRRHGHNEARAIVPHCKNDPSSVVPFHQLPEIFKQPGSAEGLLPFALFLRYTDPSRPGTKSLVRKNFKDNLPKRLKGKVPDLLVPHVAWLLLMGVLCHPNEGIQGIWIGKFEKTDAYQVSSISPRQFRSSLLTRLQGVFEGRRVYQQEADNLRMAWDILIKAYDLKGVVSNPNLPKVCEVYSPRR